MRSFSTHRTLCQEYIALVTAQPPFAFIVFFLNARPFFPKVLYLIQRVRIP